MFRTAQSSRLELLFKPGSVALYGASVNAGSLGSVLLNNLKSGGYKGQVTLVNPKYTDLDGEPCFATLRAADARVDTAIIVAPAEAVPDIITDCGECGVAGAIVISAGFRESGRAGAALEEEMLRRSRRYNLRILGPNCLGVIRSDTGFNATFSAGHTLPGRLAIVSQSGALCTAVLDWAAAHAIGFSSMISTGIAADVDFGEILDFVAMDPETDGIMLYIEGLRDARRFMSALRAAARMKPVVVMKAGRHSEGSRAAYSHTGALVGADDVFDAALRRAGALRVADFPDFFSTAETLNSGVRTSGRRLAIITNAGGPGVMAADHCAEVKLQLSALTDDTLARLNAVLPAAWSRGNPIDVLGDATPDRYETVVKHCLADPGVDVLLAILTPQALTAPLEVARCIVRCTQETGKPVFTCWMGEISMADSRALFKQHNLPSYRTPEAAVKAIAAIANYHDNQQQLLQVPDPLTRQPAPAPDNARVILDNVLGRGRRTLTQTEAKAVLAAFNIPIIQSIPATTAEEAVLVAQELGYPVAMKIDSMDIPHKTDVGGVRLGLTNARQVRSAFPELLAGVRSLRPEADIHGVVIERMWRGKNPRELMMGVVRDEVFGPVISCGLGGTLVEVLRDHAVALPPLNRFLAGNLISQTLAARLLGPVRGTPPANLAAVEGLLLRVSEMVCELPSIVEMDLNPVMVDADGCKVIDARIAVAPYNEAARPYDHMAIHPYPGNLVHNIELNDGTPVTIRPIRPEDAVIEREFVDGLSEQSRYFRFMYAMRKIDPKLLSRFTQIDYDREMALIAVIEIEGREREIGVTRYTTLPDHSSCEFAIVVADEWQNKTLARKLLSALIDAARYRRYTRMLGVVLAENRRMLAFARSLGFKAEPNIEDRELIDIALDL
jgi:acetyltransferase